MPRPNRGAYLTKLDGRENYSIIWFEQGRPKKRSTGTSDLHVAENILSGFLAQRQERRTGGPIDPSRLLVTDALIHYVREHGENVADLPRMKHAVKALVPYWTGVYVDAVSKASCQRFQRTRDRAVATVRRELTTLRAAINFAYNDGQLTRPVPVWLPDKPDGKDRWLTRSEAAGLLEAARTGRSDVRLYLPLFVVLGLYTGKRKEAILSLRWPQVDLKNGVIDFRKRGDAGEIATKTNKRRGRQPIPDRLMTFLRLAYARRDSDLGFVIHDKGKRIKDIGDGKSGSFGGACKRAGLSDVVPHTLRHTCGTWLAQKGISIFDIGAWLDQSDARTTELYAHHHPDFMDEAKKATGRK